MQLTPNFSAEELGVLNCDPRIVLNATALCHDILEPIRAWWNRPIRVHCGYRDQDHNARVGGKAASWHLYDFTKTAADIDPSLALFDWIRLNSGLPFDKVILEFSQKVNLINWRDYPASCIHVQYSAPTNGIQSINKRLAFVGYTGASTEYVPVEVR